MCFSPQASFSAALILAAAGKLTRSQASERYKEFATIPFLFAIQQASEGMVWVSLLYWPHLSLQIPFAYLFLLFAFIIWPSWIPWSLYKAEKNKTAKNYLQLLSYYGLAYSIAGIIYLAYSGVQADVAQCHIAYSFDTSSWLALTSLLLYIVPVIGSFFVSTMNYSIFAGSMVALSCAISYLLWTHWFISVWCFFAALLSAGIYFLMKENK